MYRVISMFVLVIAIIATNPIPSTQAAAPPARAAGPVVRFIGATKAGSTPGNIRIVFELINHTAVPVEFIGFRASSFNPPLPSGRVKPLWIADLRQAGNSKDIRDGSTGCGFGLGKIKLGAKTSATFDIELPDGGWDETLVRVIASSARDLFNSAGSVTLTHDQINKAMKASSPR